MPNFCTVSYWPNESLLPANARYNNDSVRIATIVVHEVHSSYDEAFKDAKSRSEKSPLDRHLVLRLGSMAPIELNPPSANVETYVAKCDGDETTTALVEESRRKESEVKTLRRSLMEKRKEALAKRANDPLCELASICPSIGSRFAEVQDVVGRMREMAETRDDVAIRFLSENPHMSKVTMCGEIVEKYKELCSDAGVEPNMSAIEAGVSLSGYECRLPTD
ncbi:24.5 kDa [Spodoptera frugiperda ascovirus 1a]|uniref:24.5 kDa n=1 Tax=Spodoptera frugiperda ascovirus 1a TaxID=113370 RepID=Q0E584_SFAVA|nr:24.5 kDa [Spodoptera frugiperda ascovirus 1a]CAL44617.1 24.5 kDa [Spodoptera frugiperda ascovirus 1a]